MTLVTALVDLGREALGPMFARPYGHYLELFDRLLAVDLPLIAYCDEEAAARVAARRPATSTLIVPLSAADLRAFRYHGRVQAIRSQASWRTQAGWLPESPQARLELYNPLVMSKLSWLAAQATANPFGSSALAWIDGGIAATVDLARAFDPAARAALLAHLARFRFVCFPYVGGGEIHGFERPAMAAYCGVAEVGWVARGGFFGGSPECIEVVAGVYEALLEDTLARGFMGTEESVFTIVAHLHPELCQRSMIAANGLIQPFFDALPTAALAHADA